MATIHPYLTFNGNAEEAFNFYKSVFGGEFTVFQRFKDMPEMPADETSENEKITENDDQKIMHVCLPISDNFILMASDVPSSMEATFVKGNNVSISLNTESREETERLFNSLSEGGKVLMPLTDTFWNAYFGMFEDKFGIHWMINYDNPPTE